MHTPLALCAIACALAAAAPAQAADYANVVSSTPITRQLNVPHEQCADQPVAMPAPTTGAGAVVGGILGGLAGNAIGAGAGRALATGIGAVAGAVAGNQVEAYDQPPAYGAMTTCSTRYSLESQVIGYDVVYQYNGQQYRTRLPQDPGDRLAISVRPEAATFDAPHPPRPDAAWTPPGPPPYAAPYPAPAYPVAVVEAPYGYFAPPPIVIGARFGYGGGRHFR